LLGVPVASGEKRRSGLPAFNSGAAKRATLSASKGKVTTKALDAGDKAANLNPKNLKHGVIQLMIADISKSQGLSANPDSMKAVGKAGGGDLAGRIQNDKNHGDNDLGRSDSPGAKIVISASNILDKVKAEGLSVEDSRVASGIQYIVNHEYLHSQGLDDAHDPHTAMNSQIPNFQDMPADDNLAIGLFSKEWDSLGGEVGDRTSGDATPVEE
jgi:hypothetical protein